jgi:hypothetical protein
MALDAGLLTKADAEAPGAREVDHQGSADLNEEQLNIRDNGWWTLSSEALRYSYAQAKMMASSEDAGC